jgi:predicted DNA-binding transcriptional regulator AlpA
MPKRQRTSARIETATEQARPFDTGDMPHEQVLVEQLLDAKVLSRLVGVSVTTIYRMARANEFPPPLHLGTLTRWPASEYNQWVAGLAAKRREQRS